MPSSPMESISPWSHSNTTLPIGSPDSKYFLANLENISVPEAH